MSVDDFEAYIQEESMRTDTLSNDSAAVGSSLKSFASRIPSIVFALAVGACAIYAAATGPILYSAAQQLKTEQIQQEDRIICDKFNMPSGSESFRICVGYLSEVRRLHGERVAAEAAGLP
jgi:hypothetical protein